MTPRLGGRLGKLPTAFDFAAGQVNKLAIHREVCQEREPGLNGVRGQEVLLPV